MKFLAFALSVAVLPSIALAQAEPAPSADGGGAGGAPRKADADNPRGDSAEPQERQICRRVQHSYSHRTQRVCMTADQWRAQQDRR